MLKSDHRADSRHTVRPRRGSVSSEPIGRRDDDGGFILLETMVALTLITTILAAVGAQYVSGVVVSAYQRSAVTAAQLASSAISEVRAYDPSDLLQGRRLDDVTAQRNRLRLVTKVADQISADNARLAFNDAVRDVLVPTTAVPRTVGQRVFDVDTYLECQKAASTALDGTVTRRDCLASSESNLLRVSAVVTWTDRGCPSSRCAFISTTLIDPHPNPTFDINQSLPPAPVPDAVPDQTVAVDDVLQGTKAVQLTVRDGTGAAPFTWALTSGSLPAGLEWSPAGTITGKVAAPTGARTSTFTVTDAFVRQQVVQIKWTVLAKLSLPTVDPKVSFVNQAITPFSVVGTGGSGGYQYAEVGTTLPPGITYNPTSGQLSGTPTAPGEFPVRLKVNDSAGREAETSFTWSVSYPPLAVTAAANQTSTVGTDDALQMSAAGGSRSYSWSASGLPDGMTIDATTGKISGRPTRAGRTRVSVTATDARAQLSDTKSFDWTVFAGPAIDPVASRTSSKGATVNVPVTARCDNQPCTYTISQHPNGITINRDTGVIGGTVASNATSSTGVTVTVTDASGATATTPAFLWTVKEAPSVTSPGTIAQTRGTAESVTIATTCDNPACTYSAGPLPAGMTFDASTRTIAGTATTAGTTNVTVTATDASGVARSSTFAWTVNNPPSWPTLANQNSTRGTSVGTMAYGGTVTGGTRPFTFSVTGLPAGLTLNTSTGNVTGTPNTARTYSTRFTVVDDSGVSASSNTITWTVRNP